MTTKPRIRFTLWTIFKLTGMVAAFIACAKFGMNVYFSGRDSFQMQEEITKLEDSAECRLELVRACARYLTDEEWTRANMRAIDAMPDDWIDRNRKLYFDTKLGLRKRASRIGIDLDSPETVKRDVED